MDFLHRAIVKLVAIGYVQWSILILILHYNFTNEKRLSPSLCIPYLL